MNGDEVDEAVLRFARLVQQRRGSTGRPIPPSIEVNETSLDTKRFDFGLTGPTRAVSLGGFAPPPPSPIPCNECDTRSIRTTMRYYGSLHESCFGDQLQWDITDGPVGTFFDGCSTGSTNNMDCDGHPTYIGGTPTSVANARSRCYLDIDGPNHLISFNFFGVHGATGTGTHDCGGGLHLSTGVQWDSNISGPPSHAPINVGSAWCDAVGNNYVVNIHKAINYLNCVQCVRTCADPTMIDLYDVGDVYWDITITIT